MGRQRKTRELAIRMNGETVGVWRVTSAGEHQLQYARSWLVSEFSRPLSLSLPLIDADNLHRGRRVEAFFDNLLPESDTIRKRIMGRYHISSDNTFDLLREIGRDCAGAIQLIPIDADLPGDEKPSGEPISDERIAQGLQNLAVSRPFGAHGVSEEFRISLAGAQEKTALLRIGDQWLVPSGSAPTTHIIKIPIGTVDRIDLSHSVENEWLSLYICRLFGLPTAQAEIHRFADQTALVITRFDRKWDSDGRRLLRLPVEDMCQATGCYSGQKYEADGGPGAVSIMDLLLFNSSTPQEDRARFFTALVVNWLLAAPDAHAKNYSIFLNAGNTVCLAPIYDVISAHPFLGSSADRIHPRKLKMAMALYGGNRHYHWEDMRRRHWAATAKRAGFSVEEAEHILETCIRKSPVIAEQVRDTLPEGFPKQIAEPVLTGMRAASKQILP